MIYGNDIDENFGIYSWTYFLLCFTFGLITLILHNSFWYILITLLIFAFNIFLLYLLFTKKYKVSNKSIAIIMGPFVKNIKFKDINKCYITTKHCMSYSTANRCLCIETNNNRYFISPKKKDEILMKIINSKGEKND